MKFKTRCKKRSRVVCLLSFNNRVQNTCSKITTTKLLTVHLSVYWSVKIKSREHYRMFGTKQGDVLTTMCTMGRWGIYNSLRNQKHVKSLVLLVIIIGPTIWHVFVILCSILPSSFLNEWFNFARPLLYQEIYQLAKTIFTRIIIIPDILIDTRKSDVYLELVIFLNESLLPDFRCKNIYITESAFIYFVSVCLSFI